MPRIFGVNLLGLLVSGIAFWMLGFVFYGVLFTQVWTSLWGWDPAELEAAAAEASALPMIIGFAISVLSALAVGVANARLGATDLMTAVKNAVFLWAGFVLITLSYDIIYAMQPVMLLVLDGAHILLGFILIAVVQSLLDGIGAKAAR